MGGLPREGIYPDLDLAVVASLSENVGYCVVEPLLSGVPVVATNVGGLPDLIEENKTGWLVPPRTPETLARAMAVILPVNTIAQTWFPYFVSVLRDRAGNYGIAMGVVLTLALIGALSIAILPKHRQVSLPASAEKPVKVTARV